MASNEGVPVVEEGVNKTLTYLRSTHLIQILLKKALTVCVIALYNANHKGYTNHHKRLTMQAASD